MSVEELQGKIRAINNVMWTIMGIMFFIVGTALTLYFIDFFSEFPLAIMGGVVAMSGASFSMMAGRKPYQEELKRRGIEA